MKTASYNVRRATPGYEMDGRAWYAYDNVRRGYLTPSGVTIDYNAMNHHLRASTWYKTRESARNAVRAAKRLDNL